MVIVVKDERSIRASLERLKPQCEENAAECIVVDASDGRLRDVAASFPWVRWIDYRQPSGRRFTIAQQRNVGVQAAGSHRIAFCDAGCEPAADWLAQILRFLDAAPDTCCCGPIVSQDSPPLKTVNDLANGASVRYSCTANMGVARALFDELGGFNENLDHGEDIDFGWRLEDVGHPVLCARGAQMAVRWGDAGRQRWRAFRYGRSTPTLMVSNPTHALEYCRHAPDTVLYPVWILGVPCTCLIGIYVFWWVPLVWVCALAVPVVKNRSEKRIANYLLVKLARASGFLIGVPRVFTRHARRRSAAPVARVRTIRRDDCDSAYP